MSLLRKYINPQTHSVKEPTLKDCINSVTITNFKSKYQQHAIQRLERNVQDKKAIDMQKKLPVGEDGVSIWQ